jgi:hypothetical protein
MKIYTSTIEPKVYLSVQVDSETGLTADNTTITVDSTDITSDTI